MKPKTTVIIPARYESSRLPGKALIDLAGKPIIQHVYERASMAKHADRVIVATDDERILDCVQGFGGDATLTSKAHTSGTDRIAEVASNIDTDIVCNVQGDEVGIHPDAIDMVIEPLLSDESVGIANLCAVTEKESDLLNPNVVKVALDVNGNFLYLTRSPIPYPMSEHKFKVHRQVGVYAFRKSELLNFSRLSPSPLERTERIEFLRLLENRIRVQGVVTDYESFDVNVLGDVPAALQMISKGIKKKIQ